MGTSINARVAGRPNIGDGGVVSVGVGKDFPDIQEAIDYLGDGVELLNTLTSQAIIVSTSATTVAGIGTTWRTGKQIRVGDLIQMGSETKYYKVKGVQDTELDLEEPYLGVGIAGTVSVRVYRLRWRTIMLYPGEYVAPLDTGYVLQNGIAIVGHDKSKTFVTRLSEGDSTPVGPFENWGINSLAHLTLGPTDDWSDLDAVIGGNPNDDCWGGETVYWDNLRILCYDNGGDHGNGFGSIPVPAYGTMQVTNCNIEYETQSQALVYGQGKANVTAANTVLKIRNTDLIQAHSWYSFPGHTPTAGPFALAVFKNITYDLQDVRIHQGRGLAQNAPSSVGTNSAIYLYGTTSAVVNLNNCKILNDNGATCYGINIASGVTSTVNITFTDIEASAGAGTGHGIWSEASGSTVNIRHSRIKGSSTAITNTAGTINAMQANGTDHGTVTLIGGTSGVITAAET